MLQIIGLFAISWILIWLFEKNNLRVLGLAPPVRTLKLVALLFLVTAICCSTGFLMKIYFAREQYMVNPELTTKIVFAEIWENIRSVLTEELICRGVLLYILIRKLGNKWAIMISATIFGLLHWFNSGVFGNALQMFIVFGFTFGMGILLAYSYSKTFSIWVPFSIHLGWNLTQNFIFPDTASGNHVFILAAPPPIITVSYLVFFTMLLFPKISAILLNYLILKRRKRQLAKALILMTNT